MKRSNHRLSSNKYQATHCTYSSKPKLREVTTELHEVSPANRSGRYSRVSEDRLHCEGQENDVGSNPARSEKSKSPRFVNPRKSAASNSIPIEPMLSNPGPDNIGLSCGPGVGSTVRLSSVRPRFWDRILSVNQIMTGHAPVVCWPRISWIAFATCRPLCRRSAHSGV